MNHHVVPPLVLALAAGAVLPVGMSRSHWPHQAPRLALATWSALAAVFIAASSCAALLLLLPYRSSVHLSDLAEACLPWAAQACVAPHLAGVRPTDLPAIAVALALLLLPAALFLREAIRTRRLRVRHTELLNLVGRWEPALDATLFEHKTPAIYCVPGRSSQVVVSTGALRALTVVQLDAALRHERAHIAGRHHLLTVAAQSLSHSFPPIPLIRRITSEVPLLVEMTADDRALRACSREALATALYSVATGRAPQWTMSAGGPSAVLRVRRILTQESGRPVLLGLLTSAAVICAVTPIALACCLIQG